MLPRITVTLSILLAGIAAYGEPPDPNSSAKDKPGQLRHDANGVPQMWGGPDLREIRNIGELDVALAVSHQRPILVYKHSTECPISARAAARLDAYAHEHGDSAPIVYWVKVIESRPASKALAEATHVEHESPQLLLIEDGKALWHTSHDDITVGNIEQALEQHLKPAEE